MPRDFELPIRFVLSMILAASPGLAQTPTAAVGDELQVNTYTTGNQFFPSAAVLGNGDFVVVWETTEADNGDTHSVQGRRYTSGGDPLGDAFLVNTYTTGSQEEPAIAVNPNGGFVVAWESAGSDGGDTSGTSIRGQRFADNGDPLGAPFQANTYTTNGQGVPRLAVADDGAFVVVWRSDGSDDGDTSNVSIQARLFASDGMPVGDQFQVNSYTSNAQTQPSVAMRGNGEFVVVWRSYGSDNGDTGNASVQGQRFASDGSLLGVQFLVNSYTSSAQEEPDVAMAPDGSFVVAWASFGSSGSDTSNHSIQAQRYASDGTPTGGEVQVNTYTNGGQRVPSVGIDGDGDFVVTWRSYGSDNGDNSNNSVQGRRFASDGDPIGGQFRINSYVPGSQGDPSLAVDDAGDFVVAWHSFGSTDDPSSYTIKAQPFRVTASIGDLVFRDTDSDGRRSAFDPGTGGVTVYLRDPLGDLVDLTTTDGNGGFLFQPKIALEGVADQFYLEFDPSSDYVFTTADVGDDDSVDSDADAMGLTPTITVSSAGESFLDLDAGLIEDIAVIGDRLWNDINLDGVQQLGENNVSLGPVTFLLLDDTDAVVGSDVAGKDGIYTFEGVPSGTYRVEIVLPEDAALVVPGAGDTALLDSDFDPITKRTDPFEYVEGTIVRDLDAGIVRPSSGQTPTIAEGDPFLVNTFTTDDQREAVAAADEDGDFIIVWESGLADGDASDFSVQAQRYGSDGAELGSQFQVNTYTTDDQYRMSVDMGANGDFVVAWSSYAYENGDTSYFGVQAQRYASDGVAIGEQFRVNTYTLYFQVSPDVTVLDDGGFVVVWQSEGGFGNDDSGYSIQGQRYSSSGDPLAAQFQVNTYTSSAQRVAEVASAANGDFVVVWASNGSDADDSESSIQGQRFGSAGDPIAGQFQVNAYTTGSQSEPTLAVAPDGHFVVAWESYGSDGGDTDQRSIQARRYASDGSALGDPFQVNTYTTANQSSPDIDMDGDGDFVIVWDSFGSDLGDDDRFSIQGARYASDGDPIGEIFLVNSYTTEGQLLPTVAVDGHGDFVVAWRGYRDDNGDDDPRNIQAQRFRTTAEVGGRVFLDEDVDGLQVGGETGVAGVVVHLWDTSGNLIDSTTTGGAGNFRFRPKIGSRGIVDQLYVQFELPESFSFTLRDEGSNDNLDSDADRITGATTPFILLSAGDSRLSIDAGLIEGPFFSDGFESGNTSAWSNAVP